MAAFLKRCHYLFLLAAVLGTVSCVAKPEYPAQPTPPPLARKAINAPYFPGSAASHMPSATPVAPAMSAGQPSVGAPVMVKVAVLVPLSGESADLGQALLDAATLALFDKYGSMPPGSESARIVLIPKDTKGTPSGAAAAAQSALSDGAELIIGPVFSRGVTAVAPLARAKGVNVLTFSNNQSVVEPGVFLLGFTPEEQAMRITDYAIRRGINSLIGIAPQDAFGKAVTSAMTTTTRNHGVPDPSFEYYAAHGGGLNDTMASLATRLSLADHSQPTGIFIPEGGERLHAMMRALTRSPDSAKITNIRLIGTGLWDDPALLRAPYMQGAWFASSPSTQYKGFEERFYKQYKYRPPRIASLAYDAVALASSLALAKGGANFSAATLTDAAGFIGPANGIFRFNKRGISERGLAVLEITPKGFQQIDPAPESF